MQDKSIIWLVVVLFVLLVGAGIFGYIYYNKYQEKNEELATSNLTILQNEQYHREIVKQKDDSIQTLSGLVEDLNIEIKEEKGKFVTQTTELKLQLEALKDSGETISITGVDDNGTYLDVPFSGKQFIATYNGFTRHYYNLNKNYWWIDIIYDPIDVYSSFYLDSNKVWTLKTSTTAPGITLRTDYHIDPAFYSHFENLDPARFIKDKSILILKLKAGIAGSWHQDPLYKDHPVFLSAEIYYDFVYGAYHPFQKYVAFGFYYDIDLIKSFTTFKNIFSIFKN